MAKHQAVVKKENTLAGQILFAEAKARLDTILDLIDEFNEIGEGLEAMGYGPVMMDEDWERPSVRTNWN